MLQILRRLLYKLQGKVLALEADSLTAPAIAALDNGTPDGDDLIPYVEKTAAVSRVETGSCSTLGTNGSVITAGPVSGTVTAATTSATQIARGVDENEFATNIAAWLNTGGNLAAIGATSAVVNDAPANNSVIVTFPAGANSVVFTENDPNFSWVETTPGADEIDALKSTTPGQAQAMRFVSTGENLLLDSSNENDYWGVTVRLTDSAIVTFDDSLSDGFWCNIKETIGADQAIETNGSLITTPDNWTGVAADGFVTVYAYQGDIEIIGQGAVI